jgi:hypothetical protein
MAESRRTLVGSVVVDPSAAYLMWRLTALQALSRHRFGAR